MVSSAERRVPITVKLVMYDFLAMRVGEPISFGRLLLPVARRPWGHAVECSAIKGNPCAVANTSYAVDRQSTSWGGNAMMKTIDHVGFSGLGGNS
jgi:hypothetical protein